MKQWTEADFAKAIDQITNETQKALAAQPKVKIYVHSETGAPWEGCINGHSMLIKTNEFVEVPEDVATLIENNTKVLRESAETMAAFTSKKGKKVADM